VGHHQQRTRVDSERLLAGFQPDAAQEVLQEDGAGGCKGQGTVRGFIDTDTIGLVMEAVVCAKGSSRACRKDGLI